MKTQEFKGLCLSLPTLNPSKLIAPIHICSWLIKMFISLEILIIWIVRDF